MAALPNPRHEAYAGKRAMGYTQIHSYRSAFPNVKTEDSAEKSAQRLEAKPEVRDRIAEIRKELTDNDPEMLSKKRLGEMLADAIRMALCDERQATSAGSLVDKYCKMFGFYEPEKIEAKVGALDPDLRDRKIAELVCRRPKR